MVFADELFRQGVPESKKFELIYRQGGSLPPEDLGDAITRLRADCRYARLLAALIDASKNEKLAIEELFSGNAVSPNIVTGCKWLYTTEKQGFITEDFVRDTLPFVSSSCQRQIVSKISKWVTNVDLGDKLWTIVRARSVELSSMLLGACSNDLIMKEVEKDCKRLSLAQMLDILKKRFDSGIELIRRIAAAGKLSSSAINANELYHSILKRDFEKGRELLTSIESPKVSLGRNFTRKLVKHDFTSEADSPPLLKSVNNVKQKDLAYYASPEVYLKCFLAKFHLKPSTRLDSAQSMLKWLNHLRDEAKLKFIEAWYRDSRGSALVNNPTEVPTEFLFLLDDETLQEVVTKKIALESKSKRFTDRDLLRLQSMLPDDNESFAKQKERLKGESSEDFREEIYLNMLKSVTILKRPQYLERRLRFLASRTRNDYDSQTALLSHLRDTFSKEYRFTITEEIWPHLKDMIELQVMLKNESVDGVYRDILLVGLEKVSFDQQALLTAIMEELNRVTTLKNASSVNVRSLSYDRRHYFWNAALAYRESLAATNDVANGGSWPDHLRNFHRSLVEEKEETRCLIENYSKTLAMLKRSVGSVNLCGATRFKVYDLLEPFLGPGEPLDPGVQEYKREKEDKKREDHALKAFRKSKVVTEELRALYAGVRNRRGFVRLCGRSLLHVEPERLSRWTAMLKEDIAKSDGHRRRRGLFASHSCRLLAMITDPQQVEAEVAPSYSAKATFKQPTWNFDISEKYKRISRVESLKFFNDSFRAAEMIMPFMREDDLKHAFGGFNHHLSRLPTAKVASYLREPILKKEKGSGNAWVPNVKPEWDISARPVRGSASWRCPCHSLKLMLQGFFANTFMFDEQVIFDTIRKLSTNEEHDNIKNETLIALYSIMGIVGEEKGWPLLKGCLDSIQIEDRTCFTTTLLTNTSIDKHIPVNLEYLMKKLLEIGETETYVKEHFDAVLGRIDVNVEMLSPEFLFSMLDRIKSKNWLKSEQAAPLEVHILSVSVPEHAEFLKGHLKTIGNSKCLDLVNSMALTACTTFGSLRNPNLKSEHLVSFLPLVFEERSPENFRELRLLELTRNILPLLSEKRDAGALLPRIQEVSLKALRVTAGFLRKFGLELFEFLVADLRDTLVEWLFPRLKSDSEWSRSFMEIYDEEFSPLETMIFLNILRNCKLDEHCAEKSKELFLEHQDRNIRMAFRVILFDNSELFC